LGCHQGGFAFQLARRGRGGSLVAHAGGTLFACKLWCTPGAPGSSGGCSCGLVANLSSPPPSSGSLSPGSLAGSNIARGRNPAESHRVPGSRGLSTQTLKKYTLIQRTRNFQRPPASSANSGGSDSPERLRKSRGTARQPMQLGFFRLS
jgi:hypothetical protein